MISIDKLSYQSKLRDISADLKFSYAVLTLLICVITRWVPMALVVLSVNGYLTVMRGGVKRSRYLGYLGVPLAFLVVSTLSILLNFSQTPLDLFAIPLFDGYVTASWAGLMQMLQLVLTALASVSCLYFLSFTTPMPDILGVLGTLHCPALVMELMLLIYRYIFVLLEVAHEIGVAQASRLGQRDYKTSVKSFVALVSAVFIRAMKKSTALYDAMEARCYDGTLHVLQETVPAKAWHWVAVAVFDGGLLVWFLVVKGIG